jgi:uncharacterized protein YutE (UPF0331/DUF86 family)
MSTSPIEQEKIQAIAAEYSSKGYDVRVCPSHDQLPSFLRPFDPDIVAMSPAGNVVIQVKSSSRFDAVEAQKIAEAVESNAQWRFEMVFVSPPVAPDVPAQEQLAADEHVTRMLADAETLSQEGHLEAASLIAWSAVETILRRRAQSDAPEIERQSSARVLKHLYSLGRLDPEIYEKLLRLMEFRNAVAHGFQPRDSGPSIDEIIGDIRRLQNAA